MTKQISHRRIPPWLIGVGSILAASCTPASLGQILVDLTIEGPAAVLENTETQYSASAHLDDGSEFDVTILCDWSVEPGTYASIDTFGRLTTLEVSEDQGIVVSASFTWRDVTLDASIDVTIIDVTKDPEGDPWPFWGRTATRIGNTSTVGPQTPTIEWSIQIIDSVFESIIEAGPVMDSMGRIFVGQQEGITAVDTNSREVLWQFITFENPQGTPAVWGGRVMWGDAFGGVGNFYCVDATTGEEVWREEGHFITTGPVVDPNGVVYFNDQQGVVAARLVEDGSEVWTTQLSQLILLSATLSWPSMIATGHSTTQLTVLDLLSGEQGWTFATGNDVRGLSPLSDQRFHLGSWDSHLYCVDAVTGNEIWSFFAEKSIRGAVAVGHDGTVYAGTGGGPSVAKFWAVSPEGKELWQYMPGSNTFNPPIVAGDGTIYLCTQISNPQVGYVHALRSDGSVLWVKEMPNQVTASPMLAPDGTLYVVCRDKFLYAFKDPDVLGDLDGNGVVGVADFLILLGSWGPCPDLPETCPADLDLDGNVGVSDFLALLANWG